MGMIVPKRRRMTEISHPRAAHLPYLPEPRMSISGSVIFYGGVVSICYITLGVG